MSDFVFTPLELLVAAERKFLTECGWVYNEETAEWKEPPSAGSPPRELQQTHAVNSELLHGPRRASYNKTAFDDLQSARETYLTMRGWTSRVASANSKDVRWKRPVKPHREFGFTRAVNHQRYFDVQMRLAAKRQDAATAEVGGSTPVKQDEQTSATEHSTTA
jgi:hypothetical protein